MDSMERRRRSGNWDDLRAHTTHGVRRRRCGSPAAESVYAASETPDLPFRLLGGFRTGSR